MESGFCISKARLVVAAGVLVLLSIAGGVGHSITKIHDGKKRYYRIVTTDESVKEDRMERRVFKTTEYWYRVKDGELHGDPVWIMEREDKNQTGDTMKSLFYIDPKDFTMIESEIKLYNHDGRIIDDVHSYYRNVFQPLPKKAIHPYMQPLAFQYLDLNQGTSTKINTVFSPQFAGMGIIAKVEGEETITVPAGTFECVKVSLEFDMESLPGIIKLLPSLLVQSVMGNHYAWAEKAPPHALIKSSGKLGGPGSPNMAEELVKVE